jgi:hypothetical protein
MVGGTDSIVGTAWPDLLLYRPGGLPRLLSQGDLDLDRDLDRDQERDGDRVRDLEREGPL